MNKQRFLSTHMIAKISILGALACIVMMFDIPLFFAPPFYKIDFSEVIVLVGGFALGPLAAVCIEALKVLLNLLLHGTATAGIGEFANFLLGCAFVVPASIMYARHRNLKSAILGMIVGTFTLTILGVFVNVYIMLPIYATAFKLPMDAIISMGTQVNGSINSVWTLVLLAVVPFNLLKGVLSSIVVLLIYKRVSPLLKK